MMNKLLDDTVKVDAYVYLGDWGYDEITQQEFLYNLVLDGAEEPAYMLYIGASFVPFRVAVIAWNESEAVSAFEEWAWQNRPDELELNEETGEYEYHLAAIQRIPMPRMLVKLEQQIISLAGACQQLGLDVDEVKNRWDEDRYKDEEVELRFSGWAFGEDAC